MSFSIKTCWEVQTGGSDTNGGGLDLGIAAFSNGAATAANTASPVFSSATYNFVAADVGAWLYISAGTNWTPGYYQIVSVASNAATLNADVGAAALLAGYMSLVAGCSTVASPTGASFTLDYTQSPTPRITYSDMVIGATTTQFTSAANPVTQALAGNIINITGGVGFTIQRVLVSSVTGTTATCDKSLGTAASTGGTGKLGGCFATIGAVSAISGNNTSTFLKAGTYSITSATAGVSGGCWASTGGYLTGYGTNRVHTNRDASPVIQMNVASATLFAVGNISNIIIDGNSQTGTKTGTPAIVYNCTVKNFVAGPITGQFIFCYFTGNSVSVTGSCFGCEAVANTATPFSTSSGTNTILAFCISRANTGASTDGFFLGSLGSAFNCVGYANGRDGIRIGNADTLVNCHMEGNAGIGYNWTVAQYFAFLINCSHYNNTGGAISAGGTKQPAPFPSLTGSPLNNASSGDLSLNNLIGQGALLRAAGALGIFPGGLSTGSLDIGPVQHGDPITPILGFIGSLLNRPQ